MDNLHPFYIHNRPFIPTTPDVSKAPRPGQVKSKPAGSAPEVSFKDLLDQSVEQQEKIKFSAHAQQRARSRDIVLDERQLQRLGEGVDKAAAKGSREALVMVDQIAAIVSVENKTVITVANTNTLRDSVFTNIDSAVIN